jgi:hypothetical protein
MFKVILKCILAVILTIFFAVIWPPLWILARIVGFSFGMQTALADLLTWGDLFVLPFKGTWIWATNPD